MTVTSWKLVHRKTKAWYLFTYTFLFTLLVYIFLQVGSGLSRLSTPFGTLKNEGMTPENSAANNTVITLVLILCNDGHRQRGPGTIAVTEPTDTLHFGNLPGYSRVQRSLNKEGTTSNIARNFERQINQTVVLLKSIGVQQKFSCSSDGKRGSDGETEKKSSNCPPVHILILSDQQENFHRVQQVISNQKWNSQYTERLNITFVPVSYPPGSRWMRKLFRPCATLRLFLAQLLPFQDAVVYVDTDFLFLRPTQDLWSEFRRFSPRTLAAMAPCLNHYNTDANLVPFYGKTGLNAGIMLMNLTRIRSSGWNRMLQEVTSAYQPKIKLADQDILNIYFESNPEQLHELTCDWNFRPFQCRRGSFCLDLSLGDGISALHGNALSFTNQGPEPVFHATFTAFEQFNMTSAKPSSLLQLINALRKGILQAQRPRKSRVTSCSQYGAFSVLLLNRLNKLTIVA